MLCNASGITTPIEIGICPRISSYENKKTALGFSQLKRVRLRRLLAPLVLVSFYGKEQVEIKSNPPGTPGNLREHQSS